MSLAGAQTKLAVAVDETGRICVPMNGSPSTHILKPDAPRLPGGVQNEAFCLTLARRLKIATPGISTGRAGARSFLLIERFDRVRVNGRWRRLHQEDFCQALGKPPSAKYEVNHTGVRGPTGMEMFEVTRRHMPPTDVLRLLDMIVFSVLACNTDAHAKNYSILIRANGCSLAPLYDVMCGAVWTNVTKHLAQTIGGVARGTDINASHWQRFAKDCGLNPRLVLERVGILAKAAIAQSEAAADEVAAMPAGSHEILAQVRSAVEERAQRILVQLSQVEAEPAEHDAMPAEMESMPAEMASMPAEQAPALDAEPDAENGEETSQEPAIAG